MEAGARVDVAPYKKGPMDFVLWKPSKPGEPGVAVAGWDRDAGPSRLAHRVLGDGDPSKGISAATSSTFMAAASISSSRTTRTRSRRSRCAHGTPVMANYWMHNGFLQVEGEKMSKSLGNFVTIKELLETGSLAGVAGRRLRLAMLMTHYRQPIDWTEDSLMLAMIELGDWADTLQATWIDEFERRSSERCRCRLA